MAANGSGFTAGNPPAPQGLQVAFIQGVGSITQTITGIPAGSYVLALNAAQRANFPVAGNQQDLAVAVNGVTVTTFRPNGTNYQAYCIFLPAFEGGDYAITFRGIDSAGGDNTAFIDCLALLDCSHTQILVPAQIPGRSVYNANSSLTSTEVHMLRFRAIDNRPLSLAVQSATDQWWDFSTSSGGWLAAFDASKCLAQLKADTTFPTLVSVAVPSALATAPGISFVLFITSGTDHIPVDVYPQDDGSWPTRGALILS